MDTKQIIAHPTELVNLSIEPIKGKFSTFAAIIFLFGNVVGIGVFFKTGSILNANDGNAYGTMISWVIGFIIALSTCVCLGEVASVKISKTNAGLAGWIEVLCGRKIGRFANIFLSLGYFAFIAMALSFFAAEGLCNFMVSLVPGTANALLGNFWVIFSISIVILGSFWAINTFKPHVATNIAKYGSALKFIPMLTIVAAGLIFGVIKGNGGLFSNPATGGEDELTGKLGFGCFAAVPAVLFAFNGFSSAGAIGSKLTNPQKQIPKVLSFGMILVGIVYILVAVAQLISGASSAFGLFAIILVGHETLINSFTALISFFIFGCTLISVDCLTLAAISSTHASVEEHKICFSKQLLSKTKNKDLIAGSIVVLISWIVFACVVYIPSAILNTDTLVDGATNTCTEISFIMYGIAIIGSLINRKTKKVSVTKFKWQWPLGICAAVGCIGISLYSTIYSFIIVPIIDPSSFLSWGLFMSANSVKNLFGSIFFWIFTVISVAIPFINDLIIKLFDKHNTEKLIWQK